MTAQTVATVYPTKLNFVSQANPTVVFNALLGGTSRAADYSCMVCPSGTAWNPNIVLGFSGTTATWYWFGTYPIVVRRGAASEPGWAERLV
jgi:hypothetical protein